MSEAPAVPKVAIQGADASGRDWSWVEASVWNERMLAALDNGVKGGKWFSLIDKVYRPATLQAAWRKVAHNAGAAGVDGQSVERFAAGAETYLDELRQALESGAYQPQPVKRVEIPKGPSQFRPLGIPAVKDRIVQTAVKLVMEPIFEREFRDTSYGFRPGRGCKDALREVDRYLKNGYTQVVDADLKSYFDTIPHARLMARVEERVSEGRLLELIEAFLQQDIVQGMQRWTPTGGTLAKVRSSAHSWRTSICMIWTAGCRRGGIGWCAMPTISSCSPAAPTKHRQHFAKCALGWRRTSWSSMPTRPTSGIAGYEAKALTSSATASRRDGVGCGARVCIRCVIVSGPRPSARGERASAASLRT